MGSHGERGAVGSRGEPWGAVGSRGGAMGSWEPWGARSGEPWGAVGSRGEPRGAAGSRGEPRGAAGSRGEPRGAAGSGGEQGGGRGWGRPPPDVGARGCGRRVPTPPTLPRVRVLLTWQVLQEMLDMLRDQQNNAHMSRLEWIGERAAGLGAVAGSALGGCCLPQGGCGGQQGATGCTAACQVTPARSRALPLAPAATTPIAVCLAMRPRGVGLVARVPCRHAALTTQPPPPPPKPAPPTWCAPQSSG